MIKSEKLQIFTQYCSGLEKILLDFGESCVSDRDMRNFIEGFVRQTYENSVGVIKEIEQTLHSKSVDYKTLTDRAETTKKFLDKFKKIFIAIGITEEEIKEKQMTLNKFLTP